MKNLILTIILFLSFSCTIIAKTKSSSTTKAFEEICVKGRVYYNINSKHHGYLSLKEDSKGKSIKCKTVKKKGK